MKVYFALLVALKLAHGQRIRGGIAQRSVAAATDVPIPAQTFFVPFPEDDLMRDTFKIINSVAGGLVQSMISIVISTPNTVVWYDHWEDGFEDDVTKPIRSSTQIWGDGDPSNGCAPGISPCTSSTDILTAGQAIVIQNGVTADSAKRGQEKKFDGGDRIVSSFPVAVTRGAYPDSPGSYMAGAVEVLDTKSWGTHYVVPAGVDTYSSTNAFEYSEVYVMAGEDETTVTFANGNTKILNMGESIGIIEAQGSSVKEGDTIVSDKPIQIDLVTGDKNSYYELRWFSIRPTNDWSNEYLSPVGDSVGNTKVLLFNPSSSRITITMDYLSDPSRGLQNTKTYTIQAGKSGFSDVVPTGSGALFSSDKNFIALSMTDTVNQGQIFDWGFPVVPTKLLSPEVVIGFAFGCTDLDCKANRVSHVRSIIWLTPNEDCDIYIDLENDGTADRILSNVKYLTSNKVKDENDKDMSGARIWATKINSGPDGDRVLISAAYGQDPMNSFNSDWSALDLGTVILPFQGIQAEKTADLITDADSSGDVSPGDTLLYTINLWNVGQTDLPAGAVTIQDTLDSNVEYVNGSMEYATTSGKKQLVSDDKTGTPFALDGRGIVSRYQLDRRGGAKHTISFKVVIKDETTGQVVNKGTAKFGTYDVPFEVVTPVHVSADIDIQKTVYRGHDGMKCLNGKELEVGLKFDKVTYCFTVTNTGGTHLDNVVVSDESLNFSKSIGFLKPGEAKTVALETDITGSLVADAMVVGDPVHADKSAICDIDPVQDLDPAGVNMIEPTSNDKLLCV